MWWKTLTVSSTALALFYSEIVSVLTLILLGFGEVAGVGDRSWLGIKLGIRILRKTRKNLTHVFGKKVLF